MNPIQQALQMLTTAGKDVGNIWSALFPAGQKALASPIPNRDDFAVDPALQYYYAHQQNNDPNASLPKPQSTQSPTPTPQVLAAKVAAMPSPAPGNTPNITIPYSQGGQYTLPGGLSQMILNAFNQNNQATNAAQVLNHPLSQTYTPAEIRRFGHPSYNRGENASFKPVVDATNDDGSIDRGLFRINSNTFKGYMSNPQSKAMLKQYGITGWDDMNDPQKNAYFAAMLQSNRGWQPWFAAPLSLRTAANK